MGASGSIKIGQSAPLSGPLGPQSYVNASVATWMALRFHDSVSSKPAVRAGLPMLFGEALAGMRSHP